jgi:hypothetical protein
MKHDHKKNKNAKEHKASLELRMTDKKGDGVYSTVQFFAGNTVLIGIISRQIEAADPRACQLSESKFVLHAGLFSKVNHSCDPNCGVRENPSGALDFIALKNIYGNDEITIDYGMINLDMKSFPEKCLCGTSLCREKVAGFVNLPDYRKTDYVGFISPYLATVKQAPKAFNPG